MAELTAKENIILAAKEVFHKKGLEGTTIRDISELSGSKPPLIIYHFKNKENLFSEVLKFVADSNFKQVEGILDSASSKEEFCIKLKMFNKKIMHTMAKDISGVLLALNESEKPKSEFYSLADNDFVKFNTNLMSFITQGVEKSYISKQVNLEFFLNVYWGISLYRLRMNYYLNKDNNLDIQDESILDDWLENFNQSILGYLGLS